MYLAVGGLIEGQALILWSAALVGYLAAFAAAVFTFVRLYEEPTLARDYGAEYAAYRRAVPGWLPRLRPCGSAAGLGRFGQPRRRRRRSPRR